MEKFVARNLISGLKRCFDKRHDREVFAEQKLFPLLCPVIKLVRNIQKDVSLIQGTINPSLILNISKQISEQLSPTSSEAGSYDQVKTVEMFGIEFDEKIQKLLNVVYQIDCCSRPVAPQDQIRRFEIEPLCQKAEELWEQIVKIYLAKVCALGWVGKKTKKAAIELRIKSSVPRIPDWGGRSKTA